MRDSYHARGKWLLLPAHRSSANGHSVVKIEPVAAGLAGGLIPNIEIIGFCPQRPRRIFGVATTASLGIHTRDIFVDDRATTTTWISREIAPCPAIVDNPAAAWLFAATLI
jgi:hypothetical protein